MKDFVT